LQVTPEQARQMAVIQPGLLLDTAKQAETLKNGIQTICYELDAPKEEASGDGMGCCTKRGLTADGRLLGFGCTAGYGQM
jgi:hypothetical protein